MTTNLSVTKSVLAKLLAGENINVVHDSKLKTAAFDTKNRVLYLPVFEVMDGELYDLLVGHEDGHALFTPNEGWHSAIEESNKSRAFKDTMNVIEDARIEKLVKRKYPGLSRSFSKAYQQLFDRDFFGIKKLTNYGKLNFIDRINMYFKCGSFVVMPFNDDERALVREISNAETWEQVIDLSKRIYKIAKEEQDAITSMQDLQDAIFGDSDDDADDDSDNDDGDSDNDDEEDADSDNWRGLDDNFDDSKQSDKSDDNFDDSKQSDKSGKSDADDDDSDDSDDTDGGSDDENSDDSNESKSGNSDGDSDDEAENELESVTDRTFREREKELVQGGTEVHTYPFPQPVLSNIIIPPKLITEQFEHIINKHRSDATAAIKKSVDKFNTTNNRYINMLVKEFEMRKNASQFARTVTSRSGELDMNKLHQYRYNSDIFRKIAIVPKGKSHGIILFLDMSGSMSHIFGPTVEQTLTLAVFCKRAGIPFDLYGFSDVATLPSILVANGKLSKDFIQGNKFTQDSEIDITRDKEFHLLHLLGSSFTGQQYRNSFGMLCAVAMNYTNSDRYATEYVNWHYAGFGLGSTPFIQTLMASRPMIEAFQRNHGVDITNVIYMTDGDGTSGLNFKITQMKDGTSHRIFLIDQKTKMKIEVSQWGGADQQSKVTQFVRELTNCKHIGFYLCNKREYKHKMRECVVKLTPDKSAALQQEAKKNDFFGHAHIGYDMYFYMLSRNSNIEDEDFQINENMTNKKIARIFIDAQEGKRRNRSLVSKFAQEIAV